MSARGNPLWTRHVKDIWPDSDLSQLAEAGEQVQALLFHPGWQHIQRVLDAEVATIDGELDYGKPKEQAEYAHKHGQRSALRAAGEAAKAILSEAKQREARALAAESAMTEA